MRIGLGASAAAGLAAKFPVPYALGQARPAKAKACILLWTQGAQSQIDTWDPKPGTETGGPFREIETASPDIRICEHLPRTARQMDKASVIRTLNSKDPNHDTASYYLHTSYRRLGDLQHPHVGSVILEELGPGKTDLPGCIVVGGDPPAGAAYLPAERSPVVFDRLDNPTQDIVRHKEGSHFYIPMSRLERRWQMLRRFEDGWNKKHDDPRVESRRQMYERAWKVLSSSSLKAFDIDNEPGDVRRAYGASPLGRAVLMSRRLVQAGIRFVEVMHGTWDTHSENFTGHQRLLGELDLAYAALLEDLAKTNLLSETLVVLMGEFGRTPRVNAAKGRDHWTRCWSAVLAGGGIAGGRVVGKTDRAGMEIAERPVSVSDLYATIYQCLGVDPDKQYTSASGRPVKILDGGEPVSELF